MIRDILKTTDQKKRKELFAQLPQKYSYNAAILLLWQYIETGSPDKEALNEILELTHIKPGDENKYISLSTIVTLWPQEFLSLDFALLMDMIIRENPVYKGIEKTMHAALRLKDDKLAIALSEKLPNDSSKSDVLARTAISASRHKGHRQATWFLEQAMVAYKNKPPSTGLENIVDAWENSRLRNRKRMFVAILDLCEKSLSQKQELQRITETVIHSRQQIDKHIYAELILEKALKHNYVFLVDKLLDYVTKYKMLTRVFQRSKQMSHDDKHKIMCKYFFQLATLEENKKKSSQLMAKSREHLRSVHDKSIELQLLMNIIRRLIGIKKANKAYNMIFDVVDCYRKVWRSTNYEHEQKILIGIDFAAFLARIKEYERAGSIFHEVVNIVKDLENDKDRAHMLRLIFEKLLRYTHIKDRLSLLHTVLDILEEIGSDHDKGFALNSLGFESGGMISDLGNFPNERSEELLLRIVEIAKPLNDNDFFIDALAAMAACKLKECAYQTYQNYLRGKSLTVEQVERTAQQLVKVKKKSLAAKLLKSYLMRQE
ncbi:hypothetical protein [Candidatus Uabimicrobium amorphum]|uniref:Uncharacterized protein n=1 Tax=Uabimicrobium amorphum TaxID=2596890 RepID=A0A5S9IPJ2_UABAM|nr:hypothetical protein [Candidatus Uabimicrobium amorphum]BBM85728.1 hypothetical protein UABAM_04106 [Candidatus Uabimicrobium amorphum]